MVSSHVDNAECLQEGIKDRSCPTSALNRRQEEDADRDDAEGSRSQDDSGNSGGDTTENDEDERREPSVPNRRKSDDIDVSKFCDKVTSLKCRRCSFLCEDTSRLLAHLRHRHFRKGGKRTESYSSDAGFDLSKVKNGKREIGKEEAPSVPSIPPTPDAFMLMPDEEEEEEENCPLNTSVDDSGGHNNDDTNEDEEREPHSARNSNTELVLVNGPDMDENNEDEEDVFLCAECDIVFDSKDVCGQHMHDVHGLAQFNFEFIQEVIMTNNNGKESTSSDADLSTAMEDSCDNETKRTSNRRRRGKSPSDQDEDALVPKRYRLTRTQGSPCSKCSLKFESSEIKDIHEQCHAYLKCITEVDEQAHHKISEDCSSSSEQLPSPITGTSEPSLQSTITIRQPDDPERSLNNKKFKCHICQRNCSNEEGNTTTKEFFATWSLCANHLWRKHQINCELYSCRFCERFKNFYLTKVKDHEKTHQSETNYSCGTCNKKFKQQKQLSTHQKYHKENQTRLPPTDDSRWFTPKKCPVCNRILADAKCLKKHISAVHNRLKPYSCSICNHTSARKAELQLHMRQHTGEKPYKCDVCTFETGDHNSLRKHKMRHNDQRLYSCSRCSYRCIQTSALKQHIASQHPSETTLLHQCSICQHVSVNETVAAFHRKGHEEGRIPDRIAVNISTALNVSQSPDEQDNDNSNCSTNISTGYPEIGIRTFGKGRKPKLSKLSAVKPGWLDEGSGSVDIVDAGGVTIPASPVAENTLSS